jgi:drug/metabolite transporter (DMT)-like permease
MNPTEAAARRAAHRPDRRTLLELHRGSDARRGRAAGRRRRRGLPLHHGRHLHCRSTRAQRLARAGTLARSNATYLWGCGLLFVVYEICLSVAVGLAHDRSQAMEIGLINYLWPSLTIVLAVLCGQQAARWWLWPGVLICLWGLARVLGGDSFSLPVMWSHVLGNPLAYGMGFAAALLWPTYSLLARRYGSGFNAVGLFVTWTAIALWLKWLMLGESQPMLWSWLTAGQVLLVGALTALGYSCWGTASAWQAGLRLRASISHPCSRR